MEEINMPAVTKKVFDEALSLPAEARMTLVEKLLTSLNLPRQPKIDRLWAEEAEQRIAQIDKREIKLVPGKKVFSTIRNKYRREELGIGVRGKYYDEFRKGTNLVLLSPDVAKAFPTEEAVNTALRSLINIAQETIGLTKRSSRRAKTARG
jgi:hypothetical protein